MCRLMDQTNRVNLQFSLNLRTHYLTPTRTQYFMRSKLLVIAISLMMLSQSFGQVNSNNELGKKNETLADGLKQSEYPYSHPGSLGFGLK
jgi:hypothetical protein